MNVCTYKEGKYMTDCFECGSCNVFSINEELTKRKSKLFLALKMRQIILNEIN